MLTFDIRLSPPTHQEISAERQRLTELKKQQIKYSCLSDGVHGLALLALYFAGILSGLGLLMVVGLGTVIAVVLATTLKTDLRKVDFVTVVVIATATGCAVGGTLQSFPGDSLAGSLLAGLTTGSIIVFSALVGRRLLYAFNGLELLRPLSDYSGAEQEMLELCREFQSLEEYRQQALQLLRPNLTLGELQAMREWADSD